MSLKPNTLGASTPRAGTAEPSRMLSRMALRSTAYSSAVRTRTSSSGGVAAFIPAKTTRPPTTSCTTYLGSRLSAGSWAGAGRSTMSASPVCSAIEQRLAAPVVGISLEDDVSVGLPLHELEGPGAHGGAAEPLTHLLHGRGRHDARAVHGQRAEDGSVRLARRHVHREIVHHLRAAQRSGEARPARGRVAPQRAIEGELYRGRVEGGAVVELHAGAEFEAHLGRREHLVARGEGRTDLHLLVHGEQRLEHVEVH